MTIRVRVYAPGFINHAGIDDDGYVALPDGATLNDLYHRLRLPLPLRLSLLWTVNYDRVPWDSRLADGDVVSFLFPISGG